jgi:hypothetical protein
MIDEIPKMHDPTAEAASVVHPRRYFLRRGDYADQRPRRGRSVEVTRPVWPSWPPNAHALERRGVVRRPCRVSETGTGAAERDPARGLVSTSLNPIWHPLRESGFWFTISSSSENSRREYPRQGLL